jgi:hypothetical protein
MSVKTDVQLKSNTDTVIVVNGNREITPPLDNALRTDIIDSKINVNGGNVVVSLLGYTTELTPSDNKHFAPKKYVDDEIAGVTISIDSAPTDSSTNAVSSNGVFDALATKLNLSGGTLTGTLRTADGDATNKAIGIGGTGTGFWRDRSGGDWIKWLYNGIDMLWMRDDGSSNTIIVKNELEVNGTTTLTDLTASTILELDASKNVVSAVKGTAYNKAFGTTAGTVCEGNDSRLTTTQRVKVSLSSAQILNMFSSPVVLVPAPGAGYAIDVISIMVRFTYGTIAYSGNTNLIIQSSHLTPLAIGTNSVILPSSVNRMGAIVKNGISGVAANQYQENSAIQITTQTGNPSAGDGTLDVYITYGIVTL